MFNKTKESVQFIRPKSGNTEINYRFLCHNRFNCESGVDNDDRHDDHGFDRRDGRVHVPRRGSAVPDRHLVFHAGYDDRDDPGDGPHVDPDGRFVCHYGDLVDRSLGAHHHTVATILGSGSALALASPFPL